MQPDQPQQQPQFPSDYLNSIAPTTNVKTVNPFILWSLIAGVLLIVILVVIGVASSTGNRTSSSSLSSVGATLSSLKETAEGAQKNIQSGELRSLNSSLTLILTNSNRDMAESLLAKEIDLKDTKENPSVARVNTTFEELEGRLEDARLNAVFDRTYAREMAFTLKTLHSDMAVLYKSTNSKSLKTVLNMTDTNLEPVLKSFESFNAS